MAFCTKCGTQLADGVKFCVSCGTPVGGAAVSVPQTPAPKNNKDGEVIKCPQCGEVVNAFDLKCPTCGYEFRNRDAAKSVSVFFEEYKKAALETRAAIVRGFPLPNTREDILSFLTLGIGNTKTLTDTEKNTYRIGNSYTSQLAHREEEISAWQAKIEQAMGVGKVILADAADKTLLKNFEQQLKTNTNVGAKSRLKKILILSAVGIVALVVVFFAVSTNQGWFIEVPETATVNAKDIEINGTLAKFIKVVEKDYTFTTNISNLSVPKINTAIQFELIQDFKSALDARIRTEKISQGWQNARSYYSLYLDDPCLTMLTATNGQVNTLYSVRFSFNTIEPWLESAKLGDILNIGFESHYRNITGKTKADTKKNLARIMTVQTFRIEDFSYESAFLTNIDMEARDEAGSVVEIGGF